jgi:YhcH/YjgK/YiaL family protein
MLIESLRDWRHYDFGPVWERCMAWAAGQDDGLAPGRQVVAGCSVMITEGPTRLWGTGRYECHRRMADVQIVLRGEEDVYNLPLCLMRDAEAFDEDKDLGFFNDATRCSPLRLFPGMFVLLLPWDAHMPSMAVGDRQGVVRKMVLKIPVEKLIFTKDA